LFSGSGALGLEALSRGAAAVDFVEEFYDESLHATRQRGVTWRRPAAAVVHRADAFQFIDGHRRPRLRRPRSPIRPTISALRWAVAERWLAKPFADVPGAWSTARTRRFPEPGERRKVRRHGDHVLSCIEFVILRSEATKDLLFLTPVEQQILRFAEDDN